MQLEKRPLAEIKPYEKNPRLVEAPEVLLINGPSLVDSGGLFG